MRAAEPTIEIVTQLPRLGPRPADSHKGTFGRVVVVAGSRGMVGAAVLCGSGALRGGAGLVTVAVPEEILPQVAVANPCYLTSPLPQDQEGRLSELAEAPLLSLARANDVAAVGPGLGRSPALTGLVSALVTKVEIPLVLDADALNSLEDHTDPLRHRSVPIILTPHPGEFARLVGSDAAMVQSQGQDMAARFAREHGLVVVLKGHNTIVTNGLRVYYNRTGNPGMATGGTGDVLTGLIAALLAQKIDPFAAAQLGVHLHGLAGDLAREDLGEVSLIASDLLHYLPRAFRDFKPR